MKYIIFLLLILIGCSNNRTIEKKDRIQDLTDFQRFVNNFKVSRLPHCISKSDDYLLTNSLNDTINDKYSTNKYLKIDTIFYKYLNLKPYEYNDSCDIRYGLNLFQNSKLTILLSIKDSLWNNLYNHHFSIMLNTYFKSKFISSIVFAGSISNIGETYGCIDNNLNMRISTLRFLNYDQQTGGMHSKETIQNYSIQKSGEILLKEHEEKEGIYVFKDGAYKLVSQLNENRK